jgi:hypothetical protein
VCSAVLPARSITACDQLGWSCDECLSALSRSWRFQHPTNRVTPFPPPPSVTVKSPQITHHAGTPSITAAFKSIELANLLSTAASSQARALPADGTPPAAGGCDGTHGLYPPASPRNQGSTSLYLGADATGASLASLTVPAMRHALLSVSLHLSLSSSNLLPPRHHTLQTRSQAGRMVPMGHDVLTALVCARMRARPWCRRLCCAPAGVGHPPTPCSYCCKGLCIIQLDTEAWLEYDNLRWGERVQDAVRQLELACGNDHPYTCGTRWCCVPCLLSCPEQPSRALCFLRSPLHSLLGLGFRVQGGFRV